ncbi:ribonuclease T2 family protein [Nitrosomonas sp.]|uniref:ribonuclease T2 family protein n=1 Tax=Nitrosomonas sp. TaxID=42353 RepID=UPI001D6D5FFA|nr:ribonuclease T [Nitrosomonas sp.]MBX3617316.1 ribonuclease T [Nitrosomonas sp.]
MTVLRKNTVFQVLLIIVTFSFFQPAWAEKASGEFTAQQACPAFVSKNKSTNPDNAKILTGNKYAITEVLTANNPSWYRVVVPTANPQERWVSASCGEAELSGGGGGGGGGGSCNTAGQADSYVLALTWQPAFCETKPDKKECKITDPKVYQARHFTLHGLWPNKDGCQKNYGFCGDIKSQKPEFCDYPAVQLDDDSRISLAEVMPSVTAGSCLERHEWHKHGTCQTKWPMEEFFDLSADLARQFNDAGMAYFMNRRIGQQVRTEDFINRATAVLGPAAKDRIKLICDKNMLVEVQISLSIDLAPGIDLEKLLTNAPAQDKSQCGNTFLVDAIGQ